MKELGDFQWGRVFKKGWEHMHDDTNNKCKRKNLNALRSKINCATGSRQTKLIGNQHDRFSQSI